MQRGDVISYIELSVEEGFSIQRGMNFNVPGKDYSIILMSVRNDAPYNDEFINNGQTIIYEGHNVDKKFNKTNLPSNLINQEFLTPNGNLTENGKFLKQFEITKMVILLERLRFMKKSNLESGFITGSSLLLEQKLQMMVIEKCLNFS